MRRLRRSSAGVSDIDRLNSDGFSPLHIAIRNGLVGEVQRLVSAGADVQGKTAQLLAPGKTPLFLAVENNRWDVARILLEAGAQPLGSCNFWCPSPLFLAAYKAEAQLVELMMVEVRAEQEKKNGGYQHKLTNKLQAEVQRFFTLYSTHWPNTECQMLGTVDEESLIRLRERRTAKDEHLLGKRQACVENTLVELFRAGAPADLEIQGVLAVDWALNLNLMELTTFLVREGMKTKRDSLGCVVVCGTLDDVPDRVDDAVKERTLKDFKFFRGRSELCLPLLGMALFNENPLGMVSTLIERGCQLLAGLHEGEQVMPYTAFNCAQTLMMAVRLGDNFESDCDFLNPLLCAVVKEGGMSKGLKYVVRQLFEYRCALHHATAGLLTATAISRLEKRFEKCLVALIEAGVKPAIDCHSISGHTENIMVIACEAAMPNLVACLAQRGAAACIRRRTAVGSSRLRMLSEKVDVISMLLQRTPVWFKANSGQMEILSLFRQVLAALLVSDAPFHPYRRVSLCSLWRHLWIREYCHDCSLTHLHVALLSDPYQLVLCLKAGADLHNEKFTGCFQPLLLAQQHMLAEQSVDVLLTLLLAGFNPCLSENANSINSLTNCPSNLRKYAYAQAVLLAAAGMGCKGVTGTLSQGLGRKYSDSLLQVCKLKASCASVIRRSLFKPLPIILKDLPIPPLLKRYILCDVLVDTAPLPGKVVSRCYAIWNEISSMMSNELVQQAADR